MGDSQHSMTSFEAFYNERTVCVTGGAGFIGGHLTERLVSLGARVRLIDDLSTGNIDFAARLVDSAPDRVRFVYASILDPAALMDAVDGCDVVFHLAAMGSVPRSIEDPDRCFEVNTTGTVRVLEASRRACVRRVVFASSSSVYGDAAVSGAGAVETAELRPLSPYAASKCSAEHAVRAWSMCYDLDGVSLRYFNVFGPRQSAESQYAAVIPAFVKSVRAGERPRIFGDGSYSRDFTAVSDVVAANLLAGARDGELAGVAINVACGQSTTILELARLIAILLGRRELEPRFEPLRAGDVPHSLADISRARELLGYVPSQDLESGLRALITASARADGGEDDERPGVIYRFGA